MIFKMVVDVVRNFCNFFSGIVIIKRIFVVLCIGIKLSILCMVILNCLFFDSMILISVEVLSESF